MDVKMNLSPVFSDGAGLPDGALHEVAASAHGAVDRMAAGAHAMALTVDPAIDRAANVGHQAIDDVAEGAESSVEWMRKKADTLQSTQSSAVAGVRQYVAVHPLQSVAIALAAGLAVGLWGRRSIR